MKASKVITGSLVLYGLWWLFYRKPSTYTWQQTSQSSNSTSTTVTTTTPTSDSAFATAQTASDPVSLIEKTIKVTKPPIYEQKPCLGNIQYQSINLTSV